MAQDAVEALRAMFAAWGMGDLAAWIATEITAGTVEADLYVKMYDRPEYQKHFPAMKTLRERGQAITEAEYRSVEKGYRDVLSYAGLGGSVYDTRDTYTRLMTAGTTGVSTAELEARIADAKRVTDATDPNVRRALLEYYGITSNDLMVYALDPQGHGKDHVERLSRQATLRGLAETTRLNLSAQYAESLAMDTAFDNYTETQYREALSNVASVSESQRRLANIEGTSFTDEDAADVVIRNSAAKTLESRRRAAREAARFAGSSGVASASLRGGTL